MAALETCRIIVIIITTTTIAITIAITLALVGSAFRASDLARMPTACSVSVDAARRTLGSSSTVKSTSSRYHHNSPPHPP
jgi:hypothetical protein